MFVWTIELSQIPNLQETLVKKNESPLQTCHEHIVSVLMIMAFWVILGDSVLSLFDKDGAN